MPSLPPFDGAAVPSCAGIRADGTTIRAINTRDVDGKSLPITTSTGDHDIFSSYLRNRGRGILSDGSSSNAVGISDIVVSLDGSIFCCPHRKIPEIGPDQGHFGMVYGQFVPDVDGAVVPLPPPSTLGGEHDAVSM